jgi:putative Holliday junction resolvase
VHLVDETNTSKEAVQASIAGGMKKKKRREKGSLDSVAAALILQRFLAQKGPERLS